MIVHSDDNTQFAQHIADFLKRVDYKKTWRAIIAPGPMPRSVTVSFLHEEPDAERWSEERPPVGTIASTVIIDDRYSDREEFERIFPQILRANLWAFEHHELDEWLRIDGKRVHEPHGQPPKLTVISTEEPPF